MKSRASDKPIPQRLATNEIVRLGGFSPWWVRCPECDKLATLDPGYGKRVSECKCISCGAIYRIQINPNYVRQILGLPLWFKETFRREVFWAVNGDHLLYLEKVIGAKLRERPVWGGTRVSLTRATPFNLPAWILSSKNRPDLLRLIKRLKKRLPAEFVPADSNLLPNS